MTFKEVLEAAEEEFKKNPPPLPWYEFNPQELKDLVSLIQETLSFPSTIKYDHMPEEGYCYIALQVEAGIPGKDLLPKLQKIMDEELVTHPELLPEYSEYSISQQECLCYYPTFSIRIGIRSGPDVPSNVRFFPFPEKTGEANTGLRYEYLSIDNEVSDPACVITSVETTE